MSSGTTKSQEFTATGAATFNVASDVSVVFVTAIGAGCGGLGTGSGASTGNPGGSSAEFCIRMPVHVTPGGTLSINVGAKSVGGVGLGAVSAGGDTTVGPLTLMGSPGSAGGGAQPLSGGRSNPQTAVAGVGRMGLFEGAHFRSGSTGGNTTAGGSAGKLGGPSINFPGGVAGGTEGVRGGGGGGGSSPFGQGGTGGLGSTSGAAAASLGGNAAATAYGAGGGGGGGNSNGSNGGNGADGYVLIEWIGV